MILVGTDRIFVFFNRVIDQFKIIQTVTFQTHRILKEFADVWKAGRFFQSFAATSTARYVIQPLVRYE